MKIREYEPSDCTAIAEMFYNTVHSVNAGDYTKEQLDAWTDGNIDLNKWNESFLKHYTVVAVDDDTVVGFGDIDMSGYLDRLYVHRDYQRKGIAALICDDLESSVDAGTIYTYASITAKPFFEKRGYKAVRKRYVKRRGVTLINYLMEKKMQ